MTAPQPFPRLFSPIRVGTMALRNRVMMPPHGSAIGNLWGSEADAERNIAYWKARADAGVGWIDGVSGHIDGKAIPGFEATGVGGSSTATTGCRSSSSGSSISPTPCTRPARTATAQLTMQGGVPFAPSATLSSPAWNVVPHVLTRDEIRWFVGEYAGRAGRAQQARLDGLELHFNHDDMVEWFLSPLTNRRTDEYGGSFENRARFGAEILRAVRDVVGSTMTVGVRMTMAQEMPGGYDLDGGAELARYWESTGWSTTCTSCSARRGATRATSSRTSTGRRSGASRPAGSRTRCRCRSCTPAGQQPGGRPSACSRPATPTWSGWLAPTSPTGAARQGAEGRTEDIRPCVGGNECISRRYVEGLPFGCAVNPHASQRGRRAVAGRAEPPAGSWWSAAARPGWSWPRWPGVAATTSSCGRRTARSAVSCGSPPPRRPTTSSPATSTGSRAGSPTSA